MKMTIKNLHKNTLVYFAALLDLTVMSVLNLNTTTKVTHFYRTQAT